MSEAGCTCAVQDEPSKNATCYKQVNGVGDHDAQLAELRIQRDAHKLQLAYTKWL